MPPIPVPSLLPPSPSRVSPPATIIAANISKHPLVSSTSSDFLLVKLRVSQDPEGNSPGDITASAAAVTRSSNVGLSNTPTIQSREPAGSIAGSIEEQVKRKNNKLLKYYSRALQSQ